VPAESRHEQIAAYVAARLAEITVTAGCWYTIQRVGRTIEPRLHHWEEALDLGIDCFAIVFPGDDEPAIARSTESLTKQMDIGIVVSRRSIIDRKASVGPDEPRLFPDSSGDALPLQWTVKNRLIKDVKDKLSIDLTFGGLVTELLVPDHENRQYTVDGWDCVHIPVIAIYHHPRRVS